MVSRTLNGIAVNLNIGCCNDDNRLASMLAVALRGHLRELRNLSHRIDLDRSSVNLLTRFICQEFDHLPPKLIDLIIAMEFCPNLNSRQADSGKIGCLCDPLILIIFQDYTMACVSSSTPCAMKISTFDTSFTFLQSDEEPISTANMANHDSRVMPCHVPAMRRDCDTSACGSESAPQCSQVFNAWRSPIRQRRAYSSSPRQSDRD